MPYEQHITASHAHLRLILVTYKKIDAVLRILVIYI